MRTFTPIKLISALALFSGALANRATNAAIKDSTITRSTAGCSDCPSYDCYQCTAGDETTLKANTGGHAFVRSLVGFELPGAVQDPSTITSCTVQFPAFVKLPQYGFNITVNPALDSMWDEATVTARNAPDPTFEVRLVSVPALTNLPAIDVTNACKAADENGEFSIYIGIQEAGYYEIWSKDSGNPAILHVTYGA